MKTARAQNVRRSWMLLAGLACLSGFSCAKLVPVPEADYRGTRADARQSYRLTTTDGLIYEFKEFETTDSTFVILWIESYGKDHSIVEPRGIKTPVVVSWERVASLERIERRRVLSALVVVSVGAMIYGINALF